ncbi:ATP-binding cassette domain-containing protein [Thermococcus sp. JCM 11816]
MVGIIGPSGSGKSTLVLTFNGGNPPPLHQGAISLGRFWSEIPRLERN